MSHSILLWILLVISDFFFTLQTNQWCQQGVDILASQPLERCQTPQGADQALKEIDTFLLTAKDLKLSNPREFRQLFDDLMTPDTRVSGPSCFQLWQTVFVIHILIL